MVHTKVLFNRRNQVGKGGKAPIEIRITVNRETYYYATGFKIYPEQWDHKKVRVNMKCPEWHTINSHINEIIDKIDKYSADRIRESEELDLDEVKFLLRKKRIDENSFIEFTRNEINNRQDLKLSTLSGHIAQLKFLEEFSPSGIKFQNMNFTWVNNFDQYMIKKGHSQNTRWKYHKFIKTYLNLARKKRITDVYPYDEFKAQKKEGSRDALTLNELKEFETLDRNKLSVTQQQILDKFLFSCYTGLRISDVETLANDSFMVENGGVYLTIKQQKSERMVRNMPLHKLFNGKAVEIFKKYFDRDNKLLFPDLSSKEVNRQLKNIASFTTVKKPISFHMARHTFGSALAELTGDVLMIKELMGHSKIETSMIYIHMSRQRIENKLDRFKFDY